MKTSRYRRCLWAAAFGVALGFPPFVFGDETTDMMNKALSLVHQASILTGNPPSDDQRIGMLIEALKLAQQAPEHRLKGHRVQAIQDIKSAIAEIRSGDPDHKLADDLRNADTELRASITLAAEMAASTTTMPSTPAAAAPSTTSSSTPGPVAVGDSAAVAPAEVTPEMEQAFLARYQAAIKKQDPDAFFSLVALDPKMDAKAREDLKGLILFGMAMGASNPNQTYSFVPIASGGQPGKPTQLDGKMYSDYLPAVVALKITFASPAHPSPNGGEAVGDAKIPLCIQDDQLMLIGLREIPGAVPPPAVDKTANFGIVPNLRKIDDKTHSDNEMSSLP